MTITIQLDEPSVSALQNEAGDLGMTPEQLAQDIVQRHLRAKALPVRQIVTDDVFRAALAASVADNEELLRRLAK